jgi:PhnB protein
MSLSEFATEEFGRLSSSSCRRPADLRGCSSVTIEGALVVSRLNPYISFTDNARQAMEFYKRVFGGTLTLSTFGEFGAQNPPEADQIMHGMLETDSGFTLMAADTPPGMEHNSGTNVAVSLSGDDADELRGYWEKLSDSGTVSVPLEKQMWGDEFGACVDQFGISWMVNIGQP